MFTYLMTLTRQTRRMAEDDISESDIAEADEDTKRLIKYLLAEADIAEADEDTKRLIKVLLAKSKQVCPYSDQPFNHPPTDLTNYKTTINSCS